MPNRTHGKCHKCHLVWSWPGKPLLRDALCPKCGTKLERTAANLCKNLVLRCSTAREWKGFGEEQAPKPPPNEVWKAEVKQLHPAPSETPAIGSAVATTNSAAATKLGEAIQEAKQPLTLPTAPNLSWKAEVIADDSGQWVTNELRFATKEEAYVYGRDLSWRWTLVREYRTVESTDPVNYQWDAISGRAIPIIAENTKP